MRTADLSFLFIDTLVYATSSSSLPRAYGSFTETPLTVGWGATGCDCCCGDGVEGVYQINAYQYRNMARICNQ